MLYAVAAMAVVSAALCISEWNRLKNGCISVASDLGIMRFFTVNAVSIRGTAHLCPDELVRRCGIKLPLSIRDFKDEYLKRFSAANPWIEKARLVSAWGGTAVLAVQERVPVAMLQATNIFLVDALGVCLPLEPGIAYTLPLMSGLRDSVLPDGSRRLTAASTGRMNRFLEETAASDSSLASEITQARFGGDGRVTMVFEESPTVVIVKENETAVCFDRLRHIGELLRGDSAAVSRIDCSYRNLAFVTPAAAIVKKKDKT